MASSGLTRPHQAQWLIRLGYDGQRFHGVQPQPGVHTAGAALITRIIAATGHVPRAVSFAARTDAGVHALANLVSLRLPDLPGIAQAMVRVCQSEDDGLHELAACRLTRRGMARAMACGKHYRYVWAPSEAAAHARAWRIVPPMNLTAMQRAAVVLVGTHDFSAFRAAGCAARTPIKTLQRVEVRQHGPRIELHLEGDGFLRKMARVIAGTLAEVGCGLRPVSCMSQLLQNGTRSTAGVTAPPCGLTLMAVHCEHSPTFATEACA